MRSVREYTSVPSCTSDWSAMLSLCAGTCTCTSHVRMHLFSISRQPGVEVQEGYTIRRHRRSGYKHFWPTATPSSLSQPCRVPLQHTVHLATWCRAPNVSGKHAETHEAGRQQAHGHSLSWLLAGMLPAPTLARRHPQPRRSNRIRRSPLHCPHLCALARPLRCLPCLSSPSP